MLAVSRGVLQAAPTAARHQHAAPKHTHTHTHTHITHTSPRQRQPENFLFREAGRRHLKAIDFGLSTFYQVGDARRKGGREGGKALCLVEVGWSRGWAAGTLLEGMVG